jgi:hypothetical protein
MGKLVEQPIKSLFNGVSRQPHNVRLPSQVEEAENVVLSVVTGGFSKRPASRHIAALSGLNPGASYSIHVIDRDADEQYIVVLGDEFLKVFDANDGTEITVATPDGLTYLASDNPLKDFATLSVADYTFVVNRTVEVEMDTATSGTITGNKKKLSELDSVTGTTGQIYRITGEATTLDDYYVTWDSTTTSWVECANPNGQNSFDDTTMPHVLVRETDGTFTFRKETWNDREVGNETTVPAPSFVGRTISDVFLHKNRLGFLSDETVFFSQAGDYFNLWPDKATEQLDSDPVDVSASTSKVTLLKWAVPFRRSVFVTAENAQFEVSDTERLTPKTSSIDLSTSYKASPDCRPITLGDSLYFASSDGNNDAIIFEYYYDDSTISNTAADVTKHCTGYVPASVIQLAGEPASGTLFALSNLTTAYLSTVYVYNVYWTEDTKAQSAWHKWTFGDDAVIQGIAVLSNKLVLLVKRGEDFFLECVRVSTPVTEAFSPEFEVKLDRRVTLDGVYDEENNYTTWTTPYAHDDDIVIVTGPDFASGRRGTQLNVTYPSSTTVRATGDWSAESVFAGKRYEAMVELSRQYLRGQDDTPQITGRLQLRQMQLAYKDAGYFKVEVTPDGRSTKTYEFTGRRVGISSNILGEPAISENGVFKFMCRGRGDMTKIVVRSDSYLPFTITSGSWIGFYNDIAAQG